MIFNRKVNKLKAITLIIFLLFSTFLTGMMNPMPVKADIGTITSISGPQGHSLALKSDGTVLAWGDNYYGALGNGSTQDDITPNQVVGLQNVLSIAAGYMNSFALRQDGTLWAWGNRYGLLPKQIDSLTDVKAVAANGNYTSARYQVIVLKNDGTVWAWGSNWIQEVSGDTITQELTPVQVPSLTNVVAIAAGSTHALALKSDGTVWAWGDNSYGKLGDGTNTWQNTPVQVTGLTGIVSIAAGYQHSMALRNDGTVWSWGENNAGQLGDGTTTNRAVPVQIKDLTNISNISCGVDHSLALKSDGSVFAWGDNTSGELGNGSQTQSLVPILVTGLSEVKQVNAGERSSFALKQDGTVWSWGDNSFLRLGIGIGSNQSVPVRNLADQSPFPPSVSNVYPNENAQDYNNKDKITIKMSTTVDPSTVNSSNIVLVDGGGNTVTASLTMSDPDTIILTPKIPLNFNMPYTVKVDQLKDLNGLLMSGGTSSQFKILPYRGMFSAPLAAGGFHTLTLYQGSVLAWGENTYGQLGNSTTIRHYTPMSVQNLNNVVNLAAGTFFSAALKYDGTVWTWGRNNFNQLGDGTAQNRTVPVQVQGLSNIMVISAGDSHMLALRDDGTVWAWGNNTKGQLGDGSKINQNKPVQVKGLTEIIAIAAGGNHSLALKADGTLWGWGDNAEGEIGDGTTDERDTPVQVKGITGITEIAAGFSYSSALKSDGTVWVWGDNKYGEGGTASADSTYLTAPTRVVGLNDIKEIRAGSTFGLALDFQNNLWSWGNNSFDELAANVNSNSSLTPVQVKNLSEVSAFAGGFGHGVAMSSSKIMGWGYNQFGQVGNGLTEHIPLPEESLINNEPVFYRLSGADRYATAIQVSQEAWDYGSNAVVLARADNFPDALAGTPLASALNAPILLTDSQTLTPQTQQEIERLNPKSIFILGGSGAISDGIETNLSQNYNVIRLGGSDRYSTAAKIASYLQAKGLCVQGKAVVAYGENFPDALAVSSLAAYQHIPIVLTEKDTLPSPTADVLNQLGVNQTIVVGGTGVVSEKVASQLLGVTRYSGSDRYQTAIQIAQGMGADSSTIFVATGNNFPDALAGSVFAAKTNSPIILVDNQVSPDIETYLSKIRGQNKEGFILGGSGVVSDDAVNDFLNILFPNG